METIAERLKRVRKSKGLSQKKISEICGIEQSSYSLIENGKQTNISIETGRKLCKALDVSFRELFNVSFEDNLLKCENENKELNEQNNKLGLLYDKALDANRVLKKQLKEKEKQIRDFEEIKNYILKQANLLNTEFIKEFIESYSRTLELFDSLIDKVSDNETKVIISNAKNKYIHYQNTARNQLIWLKVFERNEFIEYYKNCSDLNKPVKYQFSDPYIAPPGVMNLVIVDPERKRRNHKKDNGSSKK